MRYDELTGDMIGDDYSSTPYRSGYSSYSDGTSSGRYHGYSELMERVANFFKLVLQVTAGVFLGAVLIFFGVMVKGRYDNGRWNTLNETLDKLLQRNNKHPSHDSVEQPQQVLEPVEELLEPREELLKPGEELLKPEEVLLKPEEVPINRISTSCCYCSGGFVVELHGAPESFDVRCPYCYRSIHYTKNH